MTFLWEIPDRYPHDLIGEYDKANSVDRFIFQRGKRVPAYSQPPIVTFSKARLKELGRFGSLASSAMVPLVDQNVRSALAKIASEAVEFCDVIVRAQDGDSSDYAIVNAIGVTNCIDHEMSQYTFIPGTKEIMGFRTLRHLEGCLGEKMLARDKEYHPHLVVSERVRIALMELGLPGLAFYKPEDMVW